MAAVTIQPPVDRLPDTKALQSVSAPAVRFADLLTASSSASSASAVALREEVQAERFNQDGFFGSAFANAAPVVSAAPSAVIEPVGDRPDAAMHGIASSGVGTGTIGTAVAGRIAQAAMPGMATTGRSTLPAAMIRSPAAMADAASRPAGFRAAVPAPAPPPAPAPKSPAVRRLPPPAGAFVAVAVHAAARGIEVAAQVAGLNEQERRVLADEVAGMLSAHGYPPAHVAIIAAPRGPHGERR